MNNTEIAQYDEPFSEILPPEDSHTDQLELMIRLSALMNSSMEISTIRERAITAASNLVRCEAASLLLINPDTGGLYFDVVIGGNSELVKKIELLPGQGIAGWVAQHNKPIIIKDAQNDPRLFRKADKQSGFVTENMLCVPVNTRFKTLGVLQALNKSSDSFNRDDARLLTALANQIAVALDNAQLYDEVKESLYSVVNVLASTVEKRDPLSSGHAKRVSRYALAIGKHLQLPRNELVNLKLAAILHDVGMVAIPDAILHKKSRLLDHERDEVMKHVLLGEELLNEIKPLRKITPVVKFHHEHYDGTGQFGISGEQIPLLARIIAVADAFDSMTTERIYTRCKGYDAARRELLKESGKKFDPQIVKAFFESKAYRIAQKYYN